MIIYAEITFITCLTSETGYAVYLIYGRLRKMRGGST